MIPIVTADDVFKICMAFADEIDDSGQINPTNTASYKVRTPGILTSLQAELIKAGGIYSTFEISNKPAKNMLGLLAGSDYLEFTGADLIKEANGSVKAYYFEVDAPSTVYIEDYANGVWNVLATITDTTATNFTPHKGVVTPTPGATKSRLRFSGTYRYVITNYAMFDTPFQADRVPDFRPWIPKTMPPDFKSLDQIVEEYPQRQYSKSISYKWEGRNKLFINYYFEGNVRIVYRPIPDAIMNMTDALQVDDVTARTLMPYGLGMELFKEENEDIYNHFRKRYVELKALSEVKQPASEQAIIDVYHITL